MNRHDGSAIAASELSGVMSVLPGPSGWLVAAALATFAFGCGGRVDPGDGEGETSGGSTSNGGESKPGNSTGGTSKPGSPFDSTELGPCHPGFDPDQEPTRRCVWLAKGLCYDTKLAACACVCPRNRQDSVCSSGFEDDTTDKNLVICY